MRVSARSATLLTAVVSGLVLGGAACSSGTTSGSADGGVDGARQPDARSGDALSDARHADVATGDAHSVDAREDDAHVVDAGSGTGRGDVSAGDSGRDGETADAPVVDSGSACRQTDIDGGGAAEVIASQQQDPNGIAVNGTNVYWSNIVGGTILSCPVAGCGASAPTTIATGLNAPNQILVDATRIYWINAHSSIQSCPIAGCGANPPTTYGPVRVGDAAVTTTPLAIAIDSKNIYWNDAYATPSISESLRSCPLAGCAEPTVVYQTKATQTGFGYGIATDGTSVYYGTESNFDIFSVPATGVADGGSAKVVATTTTSVFYLTIDESNVYWSQGNLSGSVVSAPLTGEPDAGQGLVLATAQSRPNALVVDRTCGTVYWVDNGYVNGTDAATPNGSIQRCSRTGCGGTSTPFATGQVEPTWLTQDDTYIYWADGGSGTVWRKHK